MWVPAEILVWTQIVTNCREVEDVWKVTKGFEKGSVIHIQVSSSLMFCGNDGLFHTHIRAPF